MSVKYNEYKNKVNELRSTGISPNDYIKKYVAENPEFKPKIEKAIRKGYSASQVAKALVYKDSKPNLLKEATSSFLESANKTLSVYDALIGRLTGSNMYKKRASVFSKQSEENSNPEYNNIFNSKNIEDAAHNASRMAGGIAEFLSELYATTLTGGAASVATVPSIAVKALGKDALKGFTEETLKKAVLDKTAKDIAQEAVYKNLQKKIGETALTTGFQMAKEGESQYEAGGEQDPLKAILGGIATGGLYTLSPFRALRFFKNPETKAIAEDIAKTTESATKGTNKAIEALKEGVQQATILGGAAATSEFGSNQQFNPTEIGQQALLGGLLGSSSRLLSSKNSKTNEPTAVKEKKETLPEVIQPKKRTEEIPKNPIYEASLSKNYDVLTTPVGTGRMKDHPDIHKKVIKRAFKEGGYKDLLKQDFNKHYKILKSAGISDKEIINKYSEVVPKDRLKSTEIVPVGNSREYERNYTFEDLEEKFGTKGLTTPVTKDETARSTYIKKAFDKGVYSDKLRKSFDSTYKVLKSVGISDKEIFDKHYKDIHPKNYTKEMAEAAIYQSPKNAKVRITIDNIDSVANRALEIKDKLGKEKNKNIDAVITDIKNETNNLINKYKETYLEKFKLYKNKKDIETFVNEQIKTISKNKKPKDFYSSLIKTKALISTLPKIVKDKVKVQVFKDLITGEYLNKVKSISPNTRIKRGENLPAKIESTDIIKDLNSENNFKAINGSNKQKSLLGQKSKEEQILPKLKKSISNKKLSPIKKEIEKVKVSNRDKRIVGLKNKFEGIDNLKTSSGKLKRLKRIKEELNKINHKDKQELLDKIYKKEKELSKKSIKKEESNNRYYKVYNDIKGLVNYPNVVERLSSKEGAIKFAHDFGYALKGADEKTLHDITTSSYSSILVKALINRYKIPVSAKEWNNAIREYAKLEEKKVNKKTTNKNTRIEKSKVIKSKVEKKKTQKVNTEPHKIIMSKKPYEMTLKEFSKKPELPKAKKGNIILYHRLRYEDDKHLNTILKEGLKINKKAAETNPPAFWFTKEPTGYAESRTIIGVEIPLKEVKDEGTQALVYRDIKPSEIKYVSLGSRHKTIPDRLDVFRTKYNSNKKILKKAHRYLIEDALKNGIKVSEKVLNDYPDLVKKYKVKNKNTEIEKPKSKVTKPTVEKKKVQEIATEEFKQKKNSIEQLLTEAKNNILNLEYSIEDDAYKIGDVFESVGKKEATLKAKLKDRNIEYYITPPPELKPENLKDFDTYIKYLGLDKVKDKDFISIERSELKKLYNIRKEQVEKGITKENLEAAAQVVSYLQIPFTGRPFSENRLSYKAKEMYKEYTTAHKTIMEEIDKSFNLDTRKIIENIFGKKLADKIKVKSISQLTLKDLGGRDAVISALKEGYKIDYSNLSDKELLNKIKSVEGSMIKNPKDDSILIVLAHHINDKIGFVLHHELFHIAETHGLLSDKEVDILKRETEKRFPDDSREWYEKAADDFALYSVNKKLIPIKLRLIFSRIKQFLNRLGTKFEQHPEDIYANILSGKLKANADAAAYLHYRVDTLKPRFKIDTNDEFEKKIAEGNGRDTKTFKEKSIEDVKGFLNTLKDFFLDFGRGLAPDVYREGFHLHLDAVRHLASIKEIAHHRTQKDLNYILNGLTSKDKLLLEKVLILRDIKYGLDRKIQTFYSIDKQWGGIFKTESNIDKRLNNAEKELEKNPVVKRAIEKRIEVHNKILQYLRENGYLGDIDDLDPERYFHRITTSYFKQKLKLKMPYSMEVPKIDVLRERKNSSEPYITDYIYSDYEAISQLHLLKRYDEIQKKLKEASAPTLNEMIEDYAKITKTTISEVKDKLRSKKLRVSKIYDALRQTKLAKKYEKFTVKKIMEMPHFYTVWTLPTDLTSKILDESLSKADINAFLNNPTLKQKVGIKKYTEEILIPKSVLASIRKLTEFHSPSPVEKFLQFCVSSFKKYRLFSPFTLPKYSLNNLTSDVDIIMATTPSVMTRFAPKAYNDIKDYFYNDGKNLDKETKAEIDESIENLVLGSNITSEEVESINGLEGLKDILDTRPNLYRKWWAVSTKFNNFRESILRLAVYRYYKEEIAKGHLEELPSVIDYKATKEFLNAGKEKELSAKLAREIVGDYGNISPSGQWLRKNLIPFWSWTEVNIPRYVKLLKNSTKIKSKYGKLYPAVFAAKAAMLYSAITIWNNMMFPQVSDAINEADNGQLHLILGKKNNGEYLTLRFQGSLNDTLDWFGLGNIPEIAKEIDKGEISWFDIAKNAPVSVANKLINMSAPLEKTGLEIATGVNMFPDVQHPTVIRDKWKHALSLYGFGIPYKLLFSPEPVPKDSRGLANILYKMAESSIAYTTDINSANYHIIRERVKSFLQKNNMYRYSIIQQDKSNYAFYYKKAIQYGDKDKAVHFLAMYYYYGGTLKSMNKSIKMMNPLTMIPKNKRYSFIKEITPEDRGRLKMYLDWYHNVFIKKSKFNRASLLEIYKKAYRLSLEMKRKSKKTSNK